MKRYCVCLQLRFEAPKRFQLGNGITWGGLKWQCIELPPFLVSDKIHRFIHWQIQGGNGAMLSKHPTQFVLQKTYFRTNRRTPQVVIAKGVQKHPDQGSAPGPRWGLYSRLPLFALCSLHSPLCPQTLAWARQ